MVKNIRILVLLAGVLIAGRSWAATYDIDPAHSTIGFAVKHLMVSTTRGGFNSYSGTIAFDKADLSTFQADVTVQVDSIDTKVADRDSHLKSPDFFDAAQFPTITFKGKKLENLSGDSYNLSGDLTMHGVTKEISVPVAISGPVMGPKGKEVIGIAGEKEINRKDFGVSWNKTLDNGGMVVDEVVKIIIEIEGHKQ